MAKEIVSPDAILGDAEKRIRSHLTPVQRMGLYLAAGIGLLITVVTIYLLCFLWLNYPAIPSKEIQAATDPKIVLDNYKSLSETVITNVRELFEVVVAQALLPIFAAVLGYIFGKHKED